MTVKCKWTGEETEIPCSIPHCPFSARCIAESVKKIKEIKNRPKTNADRFRRMTDKEQQEFVRGFFEVEDFADWLKQPAEGE